MNKFETGKTYNCRSACDHNCIWSFEIIRRTAKSVWIKDFHNGETVRKAVNDRGDGEFIFPLGVYSMAPVLTA